MSKVSRQTLSHQQSLEQTLKPQMFQSLKMLTLPTIELETMLKQEIVENPLLEMNEEWEEETSEQTSDDRPQTSEDTGETSDDRPQTSEEEPSELDLLVKQTLEDAKELSEVLDSWNEYNAETTTPSETSSADDEPQYEDFIAADENLKLEYLNEFDHYRLADNEYDYIYDLIDNCNAYGFLSKDIDIYKLADDYEISPERADDLHHRVLTTFPRGITARSINECLYYQLEEDERETIVADIIIDDFDDLINKRYSKIASKYDVPEEIVLECRDRISHLDPKPGLRINVGKPQYIVPDVIVLRLEDDFEIIINDFNIPKISFSRRYQNILSEMGHDKEAVNYVREKINSAKFLIRSVFMRNRTLERVMRAIINHQRPFFYDCSGLLEPLNYATIANELGVNESTISRVVKSKYADTPFGVYLLKDFFCANATKDRSTEAVAKQSVVVQIKTMIENEDKSVPLSDQDIMDILKERGIVISRRAIAKYRDELKIPNSRDRRKC